MKTHPILLAVLYSLTILSAVYFVWAGLDYYQQPLTDRPHNSLHEFLKPSGLIGHGQGMIGGALILILFLYSARKRFRFMRNWGNIRYWLNIHIWMGVTGPLLVIFHTTFKVQGIIAIAFWSMVAVVVSGVLGRYIYIQIPRGLSGKMLSAGELSEHESQMQSRLSDEFRISDDTIASISNAVGIRQQQSQGTLEVFMQWFLNDLKLPLFLLKLKRRLRQHENLNRKQTGTVIRIAHRLAILKRRIFFLRQAHQMLHYWHIIHKPFAIVMLIIMFIHIIIAILFGYKWIF